MGIIGKDQEVNHEKPSFINTYMAPVSERFLKYWMELWVREIVRKMSFENDQIDQQ